MGALHRWDDVPLPADAVATQVSLEIVVEAGIEDPADVMLYEVHRDWNPGSGGLQRDNTSPPAPGEVWWLEAAHGEEEWGLPGASFASDNPGLGDVAPRHWRRLTTLQAPRVWCFHPAPLLGTCNAASPHPSPFCSS